METEEKRLNKSSQNNIDYNDYVLQLSQTLKDLNSDLDVDLETSNVMIKDTKSKENHEVILREIDNFMESFESEQKEMDVWIKEIFDFKQQPNDEGVVCLRVYYTAVQMPRLFCCCDWKKNSSSFITPPRAIGALVEQFFQYGYKGYIDLYLRKRPPAVTTRRSLSSETRPFLEAISVETLSMSLKLSVLSFSSGQNSGYTPQLIASWRQVVLTGEMARMGTK